MSRTPSERSWNEHLQHVPSNPPPPKFGPKDSRRNGVLALGSLGDFNFEPITIPPVKLHHVTHSAPAVPTLFPPPPPKSPRRQTLQYRKSHPNLPRVTLESEMLPEHRPQNFLLRSASSSFKNRKVVQPTPPAYTFTADRPSGDGAKRKLLNRKSLARMSSSLMLKPVVVNANPNNMSIHWIEQSPRFAIPRQHYNADHPASFRRTTLTIPFLGDTCVPTKSATKRWVAAKMTSDPKINGDEVCISGAISDGSSTRDISTTFCSINNRKQVDTLRHKRYSDAPLAVLCFNILDASSLDSAIRKWAPLLRSTLPHIPIVLLGLGSGADVLRPEHTERNFISSFFLCEQRSASGVSRARGLAAATELGAEAYIECSEGNTAALDRVFSCIIGYGTARRLEEGADENGVGLAF